MTLEPDWSYVASYVHLWQAYNFIMWPDMRKPGLCTQYTPVHIIVNISLIVAIRYSQ